MIVRACYKGQSSVVFDTDNYLNHILLWRRLTLTQTIPSRYIRGETTQKGSQDIWLCHEIMPGIAVIQGMSFSSRKYLSREVPVVYRLISAVDLCGDEHVFRQRG